MRNIMAFWMDKGIDGFRVDMAQSLVKNDYDGSELKKLWTEMRQWKDRYYPECVLISEWSRPTEAIPDGFNIDFMMHFGIPGYPSLFFAKDTPFGERHSYPYCYFDKSGKGIVKEFIENFSEAYAKTALCRKKPHRSLILRCSFTITCTALPLPAATAAMRMCCVIYTVKNLPISE